MVVALATVIGGHQLDAAPLEARTERALWLRLEGPWPASAAALAESDLRTAFTRRGLDVKRADDAAITRRPLLTVTTDSEPLDHIVLILRAEPDAPVTRRVDLTSFPADGRVLALVVAADELLAATGDQARWRQPPAPEAIPPETKPPAAAIPSVVQQPPPEAPAPPRARLAVGAGFAFEHFSGGQTHLGPTLTGTFRPDPRWFLSLSADGRQGRAVATTNAEVTSRLLGGRVAGGATLLGQLDRVALSVEAGVRVARLWFEGRPTGPGAPLVGTRVGTLSVLSDVNLALQARLDRRSPVWMRVAAGLGVPLVAQAAWQTTAPDVTAPVTAASGLVLESQAGIGVDF